MKVNIYLETDKQNQECTWRKYGYVLEAMAGRCIPVTRVGFGSAEGTYHKCNLQALEYLQKDKRVQHRDILSLWKAHILRMDAGGNEKRWRRYGERDGA